MEHSWQPIAIWDKANGILLANTEEKKNSYPFDEKTQ